MAQLLATDYDILPASDSGTLLAQILNRHTAAHQTQHSGSTAPSYLQDGSLWLDTSISATYDLKYYNATNISWVSLYTIITATGIIKLSPANKVETDGSTPFTAVQTGVYPVSDTDLATKKFVTDELAAVSGFPSGTKMVFYQNLAPTGWTKDTTSAADNFMLRVTNGTGGTSAGTDSPIAEHTHTGPSHTHTGPSHTHSMQSHTHTTSSATLSTAQLASHYHFGYATTIGATRVTSTTYPTVSGNISNDEYDITATATSPTLGRSSNLGSGSSHDHGVSGGPSTADTGASGTGATGPSGTGATGNSFAPKYYNMILASKV